MKLKEWNEEERPREKMIIKGAASLNNSELLAIILRTGNNSETAVDISRNLLKMANNSLNTLSTFSIDKLKKNPGIGETKATSIVALFELASRMATEAPQNKVEVSSPEVVVNLLSPHLKNLEHEECWVFYLNRANKIIAKERVSVGGVNATIMDVRLIVKKCVEKLASGLIVSHNHPSGNPKPGEQDKIQTKALREAANLFGISLLDHIIIAGDKYYSFANDGLL
jgi:DNA repair protein RadC